MVEYDVTKIAMAPNPHWVTEHITDDMTNAEIEAALMAREQNNLEELMRSHLQNIYMRGATDVLRGLRVWLDKECKEMGGTNAAIDKMLTENAADLAEFFIEACPKEDEDA